MTKPIGENCHSGITTWPHAPLHLFIPNALYIVTGSTVHKQRFFDNAMKLNLLQRTLFEVMLANDLELQAWALFANHYHLIVRTPQDGMSLKTVIQRLHSQSARLLNELDRAARRRVWFQYWDTCLTYEKSYYARLNYVHNNPVKHGLVSNAEDYQFCSAAWFRRHASPEFRNKVQSLPYDRIKVPEVDC